MNPTRYDIEQSIWTAIDTLVAVPVVFSNQDAPRPDGAYVSIRVGSFLPLGEEEEGPVDNTTGDSVIKWQREVVVSVSGYGASSNDNCELIRSKIGRGSVREGLRNSGIAFVGSSPVRDITTIFSNQNEDRAVVDLTFRFAQEESEHLGVIESADIQGIYG